MALRHINEMFGSPSLRDRITACIAQEVPGNDPVALTNQYMWVLIAREDWIEAWEYARNEYTEEYNPDTGARPGVITDQMIIDAVVAIRDSNQG